MKKVDIGDFIVHKRNTKNSGKSYTSFVKPTASHSLDDVLSIELVASDSTSQLPQSGIYQDDNVDYNEFGGNQGTLRAEAEEFLHSPITERIINKYFGENNTISDDDLELLFYRMNSVGCGYVAAINTLIERYLMFYSEAEFQETFGFPPYQRLRHSETKDVYTDYNYGYLFLDFFLYYATTERGFTTIDEVIGNAAEEREWNQNKAGDAALNDQEFDKTGMTGSYVDVLGKVMEAYLAEKGLNLSTTNHYCAEPGSVVWQKMQEKMPEFTFSSTDSIYLSPEVLDTDLIRTLLREGMEITISMNDFTLYSIHDEDHNGALDDVLQDDVGAHAMTVVDISDDGKIIASSWGEPYLIDLDKDKIRDYCVYEYDF